MTTTTKATATQKQDLLTMALRGFEVQHAEILTKIAEVRRMLRGGGGRAKVEATAPPTLGAGHSGHSSPQAKANMSAGQRARWAKVRKEAAKAARASRRK